MTLGVTGTITEEIIHVNCPEYIFVVTGSRIDDVRARNASGTRGRYRQKCWVSVEASRKDPERGLGVSFLKLVKGMPLECSACTASSHALAP